MYLQLKTLRKLISLGISISAYFLLCSNAVAQIVVEPGQIQRVEQAQICLGQSGRDVPPEADCSWKPTRLPKDWKPPRTARTGDAWFRISLQIHDLPEHGIAVYATSFNRTGRIFVNSKELKTIGAMTPPLPLNWNRSQYFVLPKAMLREGANQLDIQQRQYSFDVGKMSALLIGPDELLRPKWERRVLWQNEASQAIAAVTSTVGLIMIGVWLMRRSEAVYFWFGCTCWVWTIVNADYFLTYPPVPDEAWERIVLAASVLHSVLINEFILRYSKLRYPKFEAAMWMYVILGTIGLFVHPLGGWVNFWFLPPLLLAPYFAYLLIRSGFRRNRVEGWLLFIGAISQLSLSAYDTLLFATDPVDRIFLAHYGTPLYVFVVGMNLIRHFVGSLVGYEQQYGLTQRALEEANQATKDKNLFFSMVSHELKSPLQSIVAVLATEDQRAGANERRASLQKIRRAVRYMEAQIRDLFVLSVGEAGRLEMRSETFEVGDLVDEVVASVAAQAAGKAIDIVVSRPEDSVFVATDPRRVEQVLLNLVENAVKYTQAGSVSIRYALSTGNFLEIAVRDTGIGILPEHIGKLFVPYRRFAMLEREHNSLGIGLAVVQTLLTHLGGTCVVESTPGVGSTFTVRIPVALVKEPPMEETSHDAVQMLIVDDRPEMLADLQAVAWTLGYIVDTADSAPEASNLLAVAVYDVVLIDLDMPIKNGYELASEIRRGNGLNQASCLVAFSAGSSEAQVLRSADGKVLWPFDSFEQKPVDARAMKRIVDTRTRNQTREEALGSP